MSLGGWSIFLQKKKSKNRLAILFLVFAFTFSACSDDNGNGSEHLTGKNAIKLISAGGAHAVGVKFFIALSPT